MALRLSVAIMELFQGVEEVPFNSVDEQIQALSRKPRSASVSPELLT